MNLNTQRSQAQTSQPQANSMVVEERQDLVMMYSPIFREIDLPNFYLHANNYFLSAFTVGGVC